MYYYIYDSFLNNKKYDKILAQIESKITDLEIKDRIFKMSVLKSVAELVTDAVRKGAKTIIAVGNDATINQILNLIIGKKITLGIIPIENVDLKANQNVIANFLGITNPVDACEIISARKIETLNLGEINNSYFINSIQVFDSDLEIVCDKKYKISPVRNSLVGIYNFAPDLELDFKCNKKLFNPQDNFLEIIVGPQDKKTLKDLFLKTDRNKKSMDSIFRAKKILVRHPQGRSGSVVVDGFKVLKTPMEIKISDIKLDVIVGKERKF